MKESYINNEQNKILEEMIKIKGQEIYNNEEIKEPNIKNEKDKLEIKENNLEPNSQINNLRLITKGYNDSNDGILDNYDEIKNNLKIKNNEIKKQEKEKDDIQNIFGGESMELKEKQIIKIDKKENEIDNKINIQEINDNNFILTNNNNKSIQDSFPISDIKNKEKQGGIIDINKFNIEINEIIKYYMKYIIKDRIKRIIIFNYIKNNNNNIYNINIKSYLKILKLISGKVKEKDKENEIRYKSILINKYKQYILKLKEYFNNLKNNEDNIEIKNKEENKNINKETYTILIKKLIEKIILIKKIYTYIIIINQYNKNEKNKIKKEENKIEIIKKEIEEIKYKLIIYLKNIKNDEEMKNYIIKILIEIEKLKDINNKEIEKYKILYLNNNKGKSKNIIIEKKQKRRKLSLWLLIIPLFYIIYFILSHGKIVFQ